MELSNVVNIPYDGKDQWWHLSVQAHWPSIDRVNQLKGVEFFRWLDTFRGYTLSRGIIAKPLLSRDSDHSFIASYRGHEDDPEPFIYRGKAIPRIYAEISYWNNKSHVTLFREYSNDRLTPGQYSWLKSKFENELEQLYSRELVELLVIQSVEDAIKYFIYNLNDISNNVELFLEKITEYRKNKL